MHRSRRSLLHAFGVLASFELLHPLSAIAAAVGISSASPLRIGVIGAGWMGGTVGRLWVQAGHEVMFSSRHPESLEDMIRTLGPRAFAGTPHQAAEFGSLLLFTVPYAALPNLGRDLEQALRGKIVLDACNPSASNNDPLTREAYINGVATTSARLLPGTRLVRAFSSVDATEVEASSKRDKNKLAVPIASNDTKTLQVVAQLVRDAGCDPLIVGDLAAAKSFQRGGPGFRTHVAVPELRRRLGLGDAR